MGFGGEILPHYQAWAYHRLTFRFFQIVNPDVGADITLMNALAAISTATFNGAPASSPQLTICSADAQFNGGHSLDASEGAGDKHGETSSATKMKVLLLMLLLWRFFLCVVI